MLSMYKVIIMKTHIGIDISKPQLDVDWKGKAI
jgi:hypothetical protein